MFRLFKIALRPACFLVAWLAAHAASAQDISFSNISTANGLSDNFIRSLALDQNGFLWVGTNEGLNSYDGYAITNYAKEQYPAIPSKTITHLYCDRQDNIWMGSAEGAAWLDKKRVFHPIQLGDTIRRYSCRYINGTEKYGPILFTDHGQYYSDAKKQQWHRLQWIPASMAPARLVEIMDYNEDCLLVATDSLVMIVNYASQQILYQQAFRHVLSVCRNGVNTIAIGDAEGKLFIVNIQTKKITQQFDMAAYTAPHIERSDWVEVRPAPGGNLLYASMGHGFFIIDSNGIVRHFTHDPLNPYSIASNKVGRLVSAKNGTVVAGTERYGLSIFNILKKQAGYKKVFTDQKGEVFDGYITEMARDADGSFWLGAADRLIHWNKTENLVSFYRYTAYVKTGTPEIHRLCLDRNGQLWVSVLGIGIAKFNRISGGFTLVQRDTTDPAQKSDFIYKLFESTDGKIWVASASGFYRLNGSTGKTESVRQDPLLQPFCSARTVSFAEDSRHRIWISSYEKGIVCFDPQSRTTKIFTNKNGLLDDACLDIVCNSHDEIYVCHYKGFSIVHANGTVTAYTKSNGLRFDKADAFVEDKEGNMWISNAKCLVKFNPSSQRMEVFDQHENLNNGGFKPASALRTPEGELIWGTQSGVNYFFPSALRPVAPPLNLSIYRVTAGDSVLDASQRGAEISFSKNNLQFDFVAIDLAGAHNIHYQYRLDGYDAQWQEGTDIRQARYSALPPGHYQFLVRASLNRKEWTGSANNFSFTVVSPVYLRWWFKVLLALLFISLLCYIFLRRNRVLRQKQEELEIEQAINYFSSSMYRYQTVEEILWDVAKNCIGRLRFEDCVIYLRDESRQVLVQKAAYGPKSPRSFEISKPIDIPLGKGIVGSVAANRKAEIINDTSKDSRYIADDAIRLSEIAVPILSGDEVLGVIDCEHSKKRFFTQRHLSILTTIASLCASKLVTAQAEAEKRETEIMLAETKQKMAEAEMQALRAQMNPHFIFNCLNSINRYIVKSEQATASLYLTRFAKLIRLILDNSKHKNIILGQEIEALKLYIEMESLRFDNKFTYSIFVDKNVNTDGIEVPPLIIQPYIENAIWHGLLHKESGGHLSIRLSLLNEGLLQCIIEDNGVGRKRAAELKSKSATKKSLGMELTENRLLLLSQYGQGRSGVEIEDMTTVEGAGCGTRVVLKIPVVDN